MLLWKSHFPKSIKCHNFSQSRWYFQFGLEAKTIGLVPTLLCVMPLIYTDLLQSARVTERWDRKHYNRAGCARVEWLKAPVISNLLFKTSLEWFVTLGQIARHHHQPISSLSSLSLLSSVVALCSSLFLSVALCSKRESRELNFFDIVSKCVSVWSADFLKLGYASLIRIMDSLYLDFSLLAFLPA